MKTKTIMSAPTREELEKMINEYYFSNNFSIADDNKTVINSKTGRVLGKDEGYEVKQRKGRWAWTRAE